MSILYDLSIDEISNVVASSDGDLALSAERLCARLEKPYGSITEYELQARLSEIDIQASDKLASRFRALLMIKLYNLISLATDRMMGALGDLRPAELARTHASLVNSFTALTAPATKVTFDFNSELEKLSEEFGLPIEDMKAEIKEMENKVKAR